MITGVFSYVKIGVALAVVAALITGYVYVRNLQATVAVLEANNKILEISVEQQKQVIQQQREDAKAIVDSMREHTERSAIVKRELETLRSKFSKLNAAGKRRDLGQLAIEKPELVERIINKATADAQRCFEIASGAKLTESERNAQKNSEINPQCPSIANPKFIPHD